jgi:hypothetical protein
MDPFTAMRINSLFEPNGGPNVVNLYRFCRVTPRSAHNFLMPLMIPLRQRPISDMGRRELYRRNSRAPKAIMPPTNRTF